MDCYKEHNNTQEHHIEKESGDVILSGKTQKPVTAEQETDKQVENEVDPALMAEYKLLLENSNIQELLKYNTVKYHLNKIYQLLQLDYKSIQEDTITSQRDLDEAVARYLSCFRRNGVYRNEAIEEFALLVLKELEK